MELRKSFSTIGIFEKAFMNCLCLFLSDCIMVMENLSDWGTFPLPVIAKHKVCKSLQTMSNRQVKWEPRRFSEPT